ncbi:hypothetical protein KA005_76250 [bacterium]|nr:hypothetical protein [bacterium]
MINYILIIILLAFLLIVVIRKLVGIKCSEKYSKIVESYRETLNDLRGSELNETAGLLALLQLSRDNQELYMRNQWQIAYYYLLLNAGAIGLCKILEQSGKIDSVANLLIISSVIICVFSIIILLSLQASIEKCSVLAKEVYENIPFVNLIISKVYQIKEPNNVCCLLVTVCIIGLLVTIFAINLLRPV